MFYVPAIRIHESKTYRTEKIIKEDDLFLIDVFEPDLIETSHWDGYLKVMEFSFQHTGRLEDIELAISLGNATIFMVDTELSELIYEADGHSGPFYHALQSLYLEGENEEYYQMDDEIPIPTFSIHNDSSYKLCYLNEAFIHHPYRNHGFFRLALNELLRYLYKEKVHYLLLKAESFDKEEGAYTKGDEQLNEKLLQFYVSMGFERTIGLTESSSYYLIKEIFPH